MSKRHFQAIADTLLAQRERVHPAVYGAMVRDFAIICRKENSRFDAEKFYSACGINQDKHEYNARPHLALV